MENTEEIKPILLKFAPAWKRILAYIIDATLLFILLTVVLTQAFAKQANAMKDPKVDLSVYPANTQEQIKAWFDQMPEIQKAYFNLFLHNQTLISIVTLVLFAAYFILFWAASGQTLGNKILRIAVIDIHSTPLNLLQSLMRCSLLLLCHFVWYLPLLFIVQPVYKQRIHDLFSSTVVIEIPDNLREQIARQKEMQEQQIVNEQDPRDEA